MVALVVEFYYYKHKENKVDKEDKEARESLGGSTQEIKVCG